MILAFLETNPILSISLRCPGFSAPWRRVIPYTGQDRPLTSRLAGALQWTCGSMARANCPVILLPRTWCCVIGLDVATAPYSL